MRRRRRSRALRGCLCRGHDRARKGDDGAVLVRRRRLAQRLDDAGTYSDNIASTLKDVYGYGAANGSVARDIKDLLRGATFAKPYIVNVVWEGGGAHWVVCCGFKRNRFSRSVFCFSDPYYGAFSLAIPTDRSGGSVQPSYQVPSIYRGGARGHLSGWVINVV